MVVNANEFSEAMVINSITFFKAPGGSERSVTFDEFYVYMGYCAGSELGTSYDDNYINGVKYTVYESASPVVFQDTDPTIYFDSPFFYVPANGNLVFEIAWPNGKDEIYTYFSTTTGINTIYGAYDNPVGDPWPEMPHILINGDLALEQATFAGIKASFR